MAKKSRKWSNLKNVLPDYVEPESERAVAINKEADARSNLSMTVLVKEYNALVDEEEKEEATRKLRNIKYEAIERLMNRWLETQNTDIWRGEGVTVSPKYDIYPSVKDKAALMQHIKDTGQEDKLQLPWSTLKGDCADALGPDGSGEIPPGVEVFIKTGIHRRTS